MNDEAVKPEKIKAQEPKSQAKSKDPTVKEKTPRREAVEKTDNQETTTRADLLADALSYINELEQRLQILN